MKKLITLCSIALLGCTSSDQTASDDRSMQIRVEHECLAHGTLKVEAGGENAEKQKDKNLTVDAPVLP